MDAVKACGGLLVRKQRPEDERDHEGGTFTWTRTSLCDATV